MWLPRATVAVLVCSLVLLAGCGTPLGGDDDRRGRYEVPERYPPGVSEAGVEDAYELAGAHRVELKNSSRTVEERSLARDENGTVLHSLEWRTRLDGDGGYYAVGSTRGTSVESGGGTAEWWSNGTVGLGLFNSSEGRSYQRTRGTRADRIRLDQFVPLLVALEPEHAGTTMREGRELHVLAAEGDDVPSSANVLRLQNVRNVSFRAWVEPSGVVRRWHVEYTGDWGERTVQFERGATISDVGETTVPRPDWTDEALNRTDPLGSMRDPIDDHGRVDATSR